MILWLYDSMILRSWIFSLRSSHPLKRAQTGWEAKTCLPPPTGLLGVEFLVHPLGSNPFLWIIKIKEDTFWAAMSFMLAPTASPYQGTTNAQKDYEQKICQGLSSFMVHQFLPIIWCLLFMQKIGFIKKFSLGATCMSEGVKCHMNLASLKKYMRWCLKT